MDNMLIQSYFTQNGSCFGSGQSQIPSSPAGSFSGVMEARTAGVQTDPKSAGGMAQSKKAELLSKFPALSEERLDQIAGEYDIETMDSDQLYHLAETLMDEGIIPSRPRENGLNLIAVYPKALYDAFLKGERFMAKGTVREAFTGCYTVGQTGGTLNYQYPKYGLKNLEYDLWMMQANFETCNPYYTDEERARQISLANSKTSFWEFAKLLEDYAGCRKN